MNAKTLKALKGSIAKWEAIVAGTGTDEGPNNCPLCQLFFGDLMVRDEGDCVECPVMQKTGQKYCKGTPYVEWDDMTGDYESVADTIERVNAARAELAFLKSLLPRKRK